MGPRAWQLEWYESIDKIRLPTRLYLDDNIIRVDALEEFEDRQNMQVTEVFEDEDFGQVAKVEFNSVTVTAPQVATEFVYEP